MVCFFMLNAYYDCSFYCLDAFLLFDQSFCFAEVKSNSLLLLLADCRGLVQLFCYRCLQMWSADCRRFTSEKTNNTLIKLFYFIYMRTDPTYFPVSSCILQV
ncbi:hypothetical protein Hanom_Chr13g01215481 [Helianthus anomalus]